MLARTAVVCALALATAAGCKGDAKKCEDAARNFATLVYWKSAEETIAKAPPAEREKIRKQKVSAFANELEKEIDFFVRQCVAANNDDQVDCMIAAKTADQALKCAELIKPE